MTAARAEVPLDAGPVAGELFRIAGGNRRDAGPFELFSRLEMGHPHEANADDADPNHRCGSLGAERKGCRIVRELAARSRLRRLVFRVWCLVLGSTAKAKH